MSEEIQFCIEIAEDSMNKTVQHLEKELLKLRAGRSNPHMLDSIFVDYYGVNTPLNQAANIGLPDAKTIAVQPWDKSMLETIEKAILHANLGFNPVNNGHIIIINVPTLTEERRKVLVKQVKGEGEKAKVSIRNSRRDANEELKKLKKEGVSEDLIKEAEEKTQKFTDNFIGKVDEILARKEEEIMKV